MSNTEPNRLKDIETLPFASVIIPTAGFGYESSDLLECLQSVASLDYPTYEVIVVSEKPLDTDYILAYVKPKSEQLSIRFYTQGGGSSRNRNKGIKVAHGDFVAFTDDDCVVDERWLRCLIKALLKKPDVGAVCGRSPPLWERDPPRYLKNQISTRGTELNHVLGIEERNYPKEVRSVIGHNMVFRKRIFSTVGLFDPSIGPSIGKGYQLLGYYTGNDIEISLRLRRHGYKILYEPEAIVYHRIDWRKMTLRHILKESWFIGRARFLRKKKYPEYGVGMSTDIPHLLTSISFRLVAFLVTRDLLHLVKATLRLAFLVEKMRSFSRALNGP